MPSRSDHSVRLPARLQADKNRPFRPITSLPGGLEHYEFRRVLEKIEELPGLWHYAVQYGEDYLPLLAVSNPPPYTPLDLADFFGKEGPIEIEIGTGKGTFLSSYAEKFPDRLLLGLEWAQPIAWYAMEKLAKNRQHQVRMVLGDAPPFLRECLPGNCCQAFHIYFPDPWPKEKAKKRRIMQAPLLQQMRRLALAGCQLHWGTDHEDYNKATVKLLSSTPGFTCIEPNAEPTEGIQTNFEKKYRAEGKPIYRSIWSIQPMSD